MALTSASERELVVARLRSRRAALGRLRSDEVADAAAACGVATSTMYRWLFRGPPVPELSRARYTITDAGSRAFFLMRGDVAAAHRLLATSAEEPVPSLATFRRAIARDLDSATRAAARSGIKGRDQARMVLKHKACLRNERWEGDHTQIDLHVLAPERDAPVRPWMTWLIDVGTRAIVGWAISADAPTRGSVLAAIRSGVEQRGEGDLFHGVPGVLLWDNGLEFTANAVTEAAALLGSVAVTTPPYSPQKKPFIERVNKSLEVELISKLPHYVRGPRRGDGSLYDADDSMLSLENLIHLVAGWINYYNFDREHRSLKGRSPAEVWRSDPTPIREVTSTEAHHFTLERVKRKVRRDHGIHVGSIAYIAPELFGLEGLTVEVGMVPHDISKVEVFVDGDWLCTATPTEHLSTEETIRHKEAARAADKRLRRELRRVRRLQREPRIAPITQLNFEPRLLPSRPEKEPAKRKKDVFGLGDQVGDVE